MPSRKFLILVLMNIFLLIVSCLTLCSAIAVLVSNNPVFSVLSLILVFFFSSLFLLGFGLDFVAFIFLIIYIGAIAVLFLFVVMMLRVRKYSPDKYNHKLFLSLCFVILVMHFFYVFGNTEPFFEFLYRQRFHDLNVVKELTLFTSNANALGLHLYTTYMSVFVICSLLLLIGMVGAIVLTSNKKVTGPKQTDFKQILTKFTKTVFLKK